MLCVLVAFLLSFFISPSVADTTISAKYYPEQPIVGQPFYVAVTWKIPHNWHMEAPSEHMPKVEWNLPQGLAFQKWHWPPPQPFSSVATGGQSLGYEKRVTAVAEFDVGEAFSPSDVGADIRWALCKDQCTLHSSHIDAKEPLSALQWLDTEALLSNKNTAGKTFVPFVFAWMGGLILNIMPCVLPVLSLKVLDFLTLSTYSPWLRGLAFTGGVCTGFSVLGSIIISLQQAGTQVLGWGFHMQSPWFVGTMMMLFLVMGLHMWGMFEVGASLTRLALPQWLRHPLLKAWGVGLITCGVSTPCTAPFMGSALAYGLTTSPLNMMGVLLCLGLGLSTPVMVLTIFPAWMRWLPKPGMWMIHFKRFLSLGFFVTSCWLAWVLSSLTWNEAASTNVAHVEQLLASDQAVLLDFTADWCVTCQANKRVLNDPAIQKKLLEQKVTVITIDLTQHNPDGLRLLAQFQRSSIPLVIYSKGHNQYLILPPLITHKDMLDLFPKPS